MVFHLKKLCIILVLNFTPFSGPLFRIPDVFFCIDYRQTLFDNLHFSPDTDGEGVWGMLPPMLRQLFPVSLMSGQHG